MTSGSVKPGGMLGEHRRAEQDRNQAMAEGLSRRLLNFEEAAAARFMLLRGLGLIGDGALPLKASTRAGTSPQTVKRSHNKCR